MKSKSYTHTKICQSMEAPLVFPIHLGYEAMKRLIVLDIKDDPEYEIIEPQLFDDPVNGKGLRVLLYRKDKKVDVYWEPGVNVDFNTFNIGNGAGKCMQTPMSPSYFEIIKNSIHIEIGFHDQNGRRIELIVKEEPKKDNSFRFLAPVGKDILKPKQLFLAYMGGFDFVKKKGTLLHISIGGHQREAKSFAIPRNKEKVFFARYSTKPMIGTINPPRDVPLILENSHPGLYEISGMKVLVNESQAAAKMWVTDESLVRYEMIFKSGLPGLLGLKQNTTVTAEWEYCISGVPITGGTYSLLRTGQIVNIGFNVDKSWKPVNLPFSFKLFVGIVKSFRKWPCTYRWKASVDLEELSLHGSWDRYN